MKKIGVIFDLDGVIFDNNQYHKKAWSEFCNRNGIFLSQQTLENNVFGNTNKDVLEFLFRRKFTNHEIDDLAEVKEEIYRDLIGPHVKPLDGLIPLLEELKNNEIPTGIATSAPKSNIDFLDEKVKFTRFFHSIIDDKGVENGKPHPDIYLKCFKELDVEPQNCLVFEDSFSGVRSAVKAGGKVVGVTTTHDASEFEGVEMAIPDFTEMKLNTIQKILGD
ncbi:HAD family hydrolase [Bacteroidota bacterium]